ncbi:MAG TPA: alternative ribosome rescue aminoacyl-tRNA hydrolase ArfB [Caldisericia bacterium]|nr:alternative ribosome rescue aminoacyl-tRNA hydrolase ArfB [Caldisericia bacterium]
MIEIPENEVQVSFSRSSGPGGQNVNKTNTKVTITWNIAESTAFSEEEKDQIIQFYQREVLQVSNQETRSQLDNRRRAMMILRKMVEVALVEEEERIPTKPTYASKVKRVELKKQHAKTKNLRRKPRWYDDDI